MRQGTILQFRIDLLDDRVSAMDLISGDSVETILIDGTAEGLVDSRVYAARATAFW